MQPSYDREESQPQNEAHTETVEQRDRKKARQEELFLDKIIGSLDHPTLKGSLSGLSAG